MMIRPALEADLPQVCAIYAHEVREGTATYEVVAPDIAKFMARWRALAAQGYPYLVCDIDGTIAGYAYASPYRTRAGYRWTLEDTVYVAGKFHGRGIGRALLMRLIGDCEALGFRQMIAVIGDADNAASIRLHAGCGFVESGRFDGLGRKRSRWLTSVQMLRTLGDGTATPPPMEPETT